MIVENKLVFTFKQKINKFYTKIFTYYQIIDLYSINICCDVLVTYKTFNLFWDVQLQSYQSMPHYHSHIKLSNELRLIFTHQDLFHISSLYFRQVIS